MLKLRQPSSEVQQRPVTAEDGQELAWQLGWELAQIDEEHGYLKMARQYLLAVLPPAEALGSSGQAIVADVRDQLMRLDRREQTLRLCRHETEGQLQELRADPQVAALLARIDGARCRSL